MSCGAYKLGGKLQADGRAEDVEKLGAIARSKFGVEANNAEKKAAKDMNQCNCFGYG